MGDFENETCTVQSTKQDPGNETLILCSFAIEIPGKLTDEPEVHGHRSNPLTRPDALRFSAAARGEARATLSLHRKFSSLKNASTCEPETRSDSGVARMGGEGGRATLS